MDPSWAQLAQGQGRVNVIIDSRPLETEIDQLPNRPDRGALIFSTWARALAFIGSVRDVRLGELQLIGAITVPAGTWDLRGMQITGAVDPAGPYFASQQVTLTLGPTTELQNVSGFAGLQVVVGDGVGPVIVYDDNTLTIRGFGLRNSTVSLGEGATLIELGGNTVLTVWLDSASVVYTDPDSTAERAFIDGVSADAVLQIGVRAPPVQLSADLLANIAGVDMSFSASADTLMAAQPRVNIDSANLFPRRLSPAPWVGPVVLVPEQLDEDSGRLMVLQATVLYYESGANFAAGNTFSITDGTNTETWTFVAGAPAGNQVQVQGTVGESMQSLCARINATGTLWTAAEPTDLGLGLTNACVILRRAQGEVAYKDRIYATTAPQLGVLNYSKGVQYCSYAVPGDLDWPEFVTPLPTTDPEVQYFGWGSNNAPGGLVLGVLDNQQGWLYKANRQVGGASSWVSSDLYTPGAPVDWTPPAPTSISEALDRLAVVAPSSP